MSCHMSCASCSGAAYNQCLSCNSAMTLLNGICYCFPFNSSSCSYNTLLNFYSVFQFFESFFSLLAPFLLIMYYLEIKLKFTYRIFNMLQMLSYALQFQAYYYGETQYLLRSLYRANGGFFLAYRNQPFQIKYATPSIIGISVLVVWYFSSYWLFHVFHTKQTSYWEYLKNNLYRILETYYYFQSKEIVFYIMSVVEYFVQQGVVDVTIAPAIVYIIILLIFLCWTIYKHQKGQLKSLIYPKTFYIYTIFASLSVAALPLTTSLNFLIYILPLGLYFIIMVIGEHDKLTRGIILLYVAELFCYGVIIGFVFVTSAYQNHFGAIIMVLSILFVYIEIIYEYNKTPQSKITPTIENIFNTQDNTLEEIDNNKIKSLDLS